MAAVPLLVSESDPATPNYSRVIAPDTGTVSNWSSA